MVGVRVGRRPALRSEPVQARALQWARVFGSAVTRPQVEPLGQPAAPPIEPNACQWPSFEFLTRPQVDNAEAIGVTTPRLYLLHSMPHTLQKSPKLNIYTKK